MALEVVPEALEAAGCTGVTAALEPLEDAVNWSAMDWAYALGALAKICSRMKEMVG